MAVDIFAVDDSKPAKSYSDDIVGRFRTGYLNGKRPMALEKFRVTTSDPDVAEEVSNMLGGTPQQWGDEDTKDPIEVFTEASSVRVAVDSVRSGFVFWGAAGALRRCNGAIVTWSQDDREIGQACPCANDDLETRKDKASKRIGCAPDIGVVFSLAERPALGKFRLQSGSWTLLRDIQKMEQRVSDSDDPVLASMSLERVEMKNGRSFVKLSFK